MDEQEKQQLIEKARRLEGKQLFVRAAETYLKIGMDPEAAAAFEKCGAYDKAEGLYKKLGRGKDAERCAKKRGESMSGTTWQDLQSEFQQDKGNPY